MNYVLWQYNPPVHIMNGIQKSYIIFLKNMLAWQLGPTFNLMRTWKSPQCNIKPLHKWASKSSSLLSKKNKQLLNSSTGNAHFGAASRDEVSAVLLSSDCCFFYPVNFILKHCSRETQSVSNCSHFHSKAKWQKITCSSSFRNASATPEGLKFQRWVRPYP